MANKTSTEDRQQRIERMMSADADRSLNKTAELFRKHNSPEIYKTFIPTGFKRLDEMLGGGLTPGVHYIGAISSLGKSTFCLQMADSLAARGQKVVYASLEMKKIDLTAKLISMRTMLEVAPRFAPPGAHGSVDVRDPDVLNKAKSATDLTNADRAAKNTPDDWKLIEKCAETVAKHGENITILESMTRPMSVDDIELYLEGYVQKYGVSPVVFVDYLQILAPSAAVERCTDKQVADYNVAKFRMLASKFNTPIIVISSFNRASYNEAVSMSDFKETGNIEYSADTLIGLQLKGAGTTNFNVNEAKKKYPREVELVILKQRYGRAGDTLDYLFTTTYNFFDELPASNNSGASGSRTR